MEPHLQMCLNGKCVPEHENAVDFSGDGFFRRSGSSSSIGGVDDEIIENYTEPKDRPRLVTNCTWQIPLPLFAQHFAISCTYRAGLKSGPQVVRMFQPS